MANKGSDKGASDDLRRRLLRSTDFGPALRVGVVAVLFLATAVTVGAAYLPFEGAVIAQGKLEARGQNQIVQHLEGGIVSEILVKDGQEVQRGDVLIRLDTTKANSDLQRLHAELNAGAARLAVLLAERNSLDKITYPSWLLDQAETDTAIADLLADQDAEFQARLEKKSIEVELLQRQIDAGEQELFGIKSQIESLGREKGLLDEELAAIDELRLKQLIDRSRIYNMRREQVKVEGQLAAANSAIGETEQKILGYHQQVISLEKDRVELAAEQVGVLRVEIAKFRAEIEATRDVIKRSEVLSPVDGVVVSVKVNTIGAVLYEGGEVAELLPQPADLVAKVRVMPVDIDRIHVGQEAFVRMEALDIPFAPLMSGTLEYVSADRLLDEAEGIEYYEARVSKVILPDDIGVDGLYAGMNVEAYIKTGSRTFFQYVFEPIAKSFERSLRER